MNFLNRIGLGLLWKKNGFSLTNSKSLVPLNYGAMVEGSSFISWSELVQIVRAFSWKAKRGGTSSLGSYGASVKLTIWTKHKSLNKCSFFYICRSFIPWIYFPFQHTCSAAELGSRFFTYINGIFRALREFSAWVSRQDPSHRSSSF